MNVYLQKAFSNDVIVFGQKYKIKQAKSDFKTNIHVSFKKYFFFFSGNFLNKS